MAHPKPEETPMSYKRRKLYDFIVAAGPRGVTKEEVIKRFFPHSNNEIVLRTTIHYLNDAIKPMRIFVRGGIVRLTVND